MNPLKQSSESTKRRPTYRSTVLILLLITGACILSYANMMRNDFVWDDNVFIRKNYFIRDFSNMGQIFHIDFWKASYRAYSAKFYRPFIVGSLILDYAVWQLKPFGYHLTNLLLHTGTSIAVFFLFLWVAPVYAACAGALLFAVHPIHTESVTMVCGRTDVMAALFMLCSALSFLAYCKRHMLRSGYGMLALSALLYLGALFCKEAAVLTVALLVVLWWCSPARKMIAVRKLAIAIVPFIVLTALYLVIRSRVLAESAGFEHAPPAGTLWLTMLSMPKIMVIYISKLFWPVGMSIDYAPEVITSAFSPLFWLPVVLLLGLIGVGVYRLMRHRDGYALGIMTFLLTIAPVSNIISTGVFMADRFLYIPSIGWCLCMALLCRNTLRSTPLARFNRTGVLIFVLVILSAFTILTIRRNYDWYTEQRLWLKTVETTPNSFRAHGNISQMLLDQGMIQQALHEANIAHMLRPDDYRVLGNISLIYIKLNQYEKAIEYLKKVIRLEPRDFRTYANLHLLYAELGEVDNAQRAIEQAIEINPRQKELYDLKSQFEIEQHNPLQAIQSYVALLTIYPSESAAMEKIGDIYAQRLNDTDKALNWYLKAFRQNSDNATVIHKIKQIRKSHNQ